MKNLYRLLVCCLLLAAQSVAAQSRCGFQNFDSRFISNTLLACSGIDGDTEEQLRARLLTPTSASDELVCVDESDLSSAEINDEITIRMNNIASFCAASDIFLRISGSVILEYRRSTPRPASQPDTGPGTEIPTPPTPFADLQAQLMADIARERDDQKWGADQGGMIMAEAEATLMEASATNANSREAQEDLQDPAFYQTPTAQAAIENVTNNSFLAKILNVFSDLQIKITIEGLPPIPQGSTFGCSSGSTPAYILCIQAPCNLPGGLPTNSGPFCPSQASVMNNPAGGIFGRGQDTSICLGNNCPPGGAGGLDEGQQWVIRFDPEENEIEVIRGQGSNDQEFVDRINDEDLGGLAEEIAIGVCGTEAQAEFRPPDPANPNNCSNSVLFAQLLLFEKFVRNVCSQRIVGDDPILDRQCRDAMDILDRANPQTRDFISDLDDNFLTDFINAGVGSEPVDIEPRDPIQVGLDFIEVSFEADGQCIKTGDNSTNIFYTCTPSVNVLRIGNSDVSGSVCLTPSVVGIGQCQPFDLSVAASPFGSVGLTFQQEITVARSLFDANGEATITITADGVANTPGEEVLNNNQVVFEYTLKEDQNQPPDLFLLGGDTSLNVGDSYMPPDTLCTDLEDDFLGLPLSTTSIGFVDTSTPGIYTVEYICTDSGGLEDRRVHTVVVGGDPLGDDDGGDDPGDDPNGEELPIDDQGIDPAKRDNGVQADNDSVTAESLDNAETGGDPIVLLTGELVFSETDLLVPSRGWPFEMKRTYRSRFNFNGPLGYNWDFTFNDRLSVEGNDVLRMNGEGRVDFYQGTGGDVFISPQDHYDELRRTTSGFTLRNKNGFTTFYDMTGKMVRQEDRNNNFMRFEYDGAGQLITVFDTFGRRYDFTYDVSGLLTSVTDFSGRQIVYSYDGNGDLIAVRSPTVTGTSIGNDFPNGKSSRYTYLSGKAEANLNHNMVTATDRGGQIHLVNEYDETVGSYSFDRIIRQRFGGPQQIFQWDYEEIAPRDATQPALMVSKTTEMDPNGNIRELAFNSRGNLLEEKKFTNRNINFNDPEFFTTTHTYNVDGRRTSTTWHEGNTAIYVFDETNPDRWQQGNLLSVTTTPGPRAADQTALTTTYRYEPIYNQLLAMVEERGNDASFIPQNGGTTSPARYETRHTFDYQQGDTLNLLADELNRSAAEVQSLLTAAAMSINTGAPFVGLAGNIVQRTEPSASGQTIVSTYAYNNFGQLISSTDPVGHGADLEYFPANDPDGDGILVPSPNSTASTGGYLKATIQDGSARPNRTTTAPLANIRKSYTYDPVGHVTTITDGRGNTSDFEYNSLDQLIRTESKAPFNYESQFFYNGENNLERVEIENRDTNGPNLDGFVTTTFTYDVRDSVREKRVEVSTVETLLTQYQYDFNQNLERIIQPEGNSVYTLYDERDLPYQVTRGDGAFNSSTKTFTYDGNRNLIQVVDATDNTGDGQNDVWINEYDGFDRMTRMVDPIGNVMEYRYDPASNLLVQSHFGPNGGPSPLDNQGFGNVLLAESTFKYDELSRLLEKNDAHFANLGTINSNNDDALTWQFAYDPKSRVIQEKNESLNTTNYAYDGVDRLILQSDSIGNTIAFEYDQNNNLIKQTELDVNEDGIVPTETFVTQYQYDSLDRLKQVTDNLNNVTTLNYDSRGNMTRQIDALGNVTELVFDGINRQLESRRELRQGGTGAGAIVGSSANLDGIISRFWDWDGNSRLVGETDDNNNRTTYWYDELNRKFRTAFADGTTHDFVFDADDNIITEFDANGSVFSHVYDGANRRIATDVGRGTNIVGSTRWEFDYDGLGRRTRIFDNNDPASSADDSTIELRYDSIGRVIDEIQNGASVGSSYRGVNRATLTYPDQRVVTHLYDSIDRVAQIISPDPGRFPARALANYSYIGRDRVLSRFNANGTRLRRMQGVTQTGFDGLRRLVQQRHEFSNSTVLAGFDYAYDKVGNRRYERDLRTDTADLYAYDSAYRLTQTLFNVSGARTAGIVNNDTTNADLFLQGGDDFSGYEFDGVGNRTQRDSSGVNLPGSVSYNVNEMNEYTSINGQTQSYDHKGNLVVSVGQPTSTQTALVPIITGDVAAFIPATTSGTGTQVLEYDALNRLVAVYNGDSLNSKGTEIARYTYDGLGRRISKTTGGITTQFIYDGDQVIEERLANGAMLRQFVYGTGIDDVLQMRTVTDVYYYHKDALGSVVAISDFNGNVVERYNYDDYGRATIFAADGITVRESSAISNPYFYTGRRLDKETGYYYYRARYYDPDRGRFLQRDPMGYVDGMGLYAYVMNNPVNWVDPLGLASQPGGNNTPDEQLALAQAFLDSLPNGHLTYAEYALEYLLERSRLESEIAELEELAKQDIFGGTAYGHVAWEKRKRIDEIDYKFSCDIDDCGLVTSTPFLNIAGMGGIIRAGGRFAVGRLGTNSASRIIKCFPPGTLVLMADGTTKPIEDVEVGDEVFAMDAENDGNVVARLVTDTHQNKAMRLFVIQFDIDQDGIADGEFKATGEHPIWTRNAGWKDAQELRVGDLLLTDEEVSVEVLGARIEEGFTNTYNLSVDAVQTFFIVADDTPILVHNTPTIQGIFPDHAVKGVHINASNGVELKVTGGGSGSNVKFSPVFAKDSGTAAFRAAEKEALEALNDPKWRARLLNTAKRATEYLGKGNALARQTSGSTRALAVTLENWCK